MAHASGYGIFTQGARALGRADASIASLDSPSAIFFNPALLTDLEGTQGEFGTTLIFPDRSYAGATNAETEDSLFYPTTLYLSHELNDDVTFGLGVFNPFGLGTDWPDNWEGRYLATRSEIVTYDIRPVVAWQASDRLSLSFGIDYVYLEAELERMIDFTGFGPLNPDGHQLFSGDGDGFGYNLGLQLNFSESISLGLFYRSEVDIDVDATSNFSVPAAFSALFPTTRAHTELTLPQQIFVGLAYQISPELLVEASVRWEGWSTFDQLRIDLDQPVAGSTVEIQPRNWDDTFAYSIGGEYQLNASTTLLAGYLYGENSVPDATFEPAIPDSDSHLFCIGATHQIDKIQLTASYGFQHQLDRTKNNAIAPPPSPQASSVNGKYESDLHLLGFSVGYKF